jgi:hypothetical protein
MLVVFLFNVGGYYIVFWGLRIHSSKALNQRLDANQYSLDETIQLKIPVTLPYPVQQQEFRRVHGKFEHKGQHYQAVKHKLENDTLYIVCIRDQRENTLVNTMAKYARLANDLPSSKQALNFLGKLTKDFESTDDMHIVRHAGWCRLINFTSSVPISRDMQFTIASPPPEV